MPPARARRPSPRERRPPGRREATKERNRAAILAAGREVFAELGFGAASVRDVIRRTGLASGTFYNYFPDKESVFRAVLDESTRELRTRLRAARRGAAGGFEEFVGDAGYRELFAFIAEDPTMFALMRRNAGTIRSLLGDPLLGAGVDELLEDLAAVGAGDVLTGVDVDYLAGGDDRDRASRSRRGWSSGGRSTSRRRCASPLAWRSGGSASCRPAPAERCAAAAAGGRGRRRSGSAAWGPCNQHNCFAGDCNLESSDGGDEMSSGKRQAAPDAGLELVRAFVNTRDLEESTDALADPRGLAAWLADAGLVAPSTRATESDVRRAAAVREALRVELLHNGGHHEALPGDEGALDAAARRGKLRIAFGARGDSRIVADAGGVDGALGRVLAEVHRAQIAGTWPRLKACARDGCAWAFYDHTRNAAGRWCDMAVCGNRTKVQAFRERRSGAA